jgi:methyl coenzyme M reductase alpha subunit
MTQAGTFLSGIGFTKFGVSCYLTALLSNKLVYFVQFLKEKLTPSPTEFSVTLCVLEPISLETMQ